MVKAHNIFLDAVKRPSTAVSLCSHQQPKRACFLAAFQERRFSNLGIIANLLEEK